MKRKTAPDQINQPGSARRWRRVVLAGLLLLFLAAPAWVPVPSASAQNNGVTTPINQPTVSGKYKCGSGSNAVETSINIGCYGDSCHTTNSSGCSALLDATFAIIRLLSAGVGIVVVGSVVFAGIQYMSARDDPSSVGKAKSRITSSLIALLIFIFGYAILNFVIPAGFFQ